MTSHYSGRIILSALLAGGLASAASFFGTIYYFPPSNLGPLVAILATCSVLHLQVF